MIVMPQEALLAAEELAWDKKMSALRQPASKGPPPGNLQVEQTEEDPEVRMMCCVTLLALPVPCCSTGTTLPVNWQRKQRNALALMLATLPPGRMTKNQRVTTSWSQTARTAARALIGRKVERAMTINEDGAPFSISHHGGPHKPLRIL